MNWDVFITCAVTGAGETTAKSPHVPVTPQQIAESAIDAAEAGAAVAHIHVRDPETGAGPATELYREVVERIRGSGVDVVINLTAGMGGDLVLGGDEDPLPPSSRRHRHGRRHRAARPRARTLLPEICTLDCGTMNFASAATTSWSTRPAMLRAMARQVQELGVRPELRCSTPATW